MARYVANVDTTSETFATWVVRTNETLDALSTEIITANATYANTGAPGSQRNARLYGNFTANTLVAETALRGGNTGSAANLTISSNAVLQDQVFATDATDSTSNTTGAVVVTGGAGIAKAVTVGSTLTIHSTTDSTSNTTGSIKTSGGIGVAKAITVGGKVTTHGITNSTSNTTGAIVTDGGIGVAKSITVGGKGTFHSTVNSTSISTGSIITDGGVGIAKSVQVGERLTVGNTTVALGANISGPSTFNDTLLINGQLTIGNTTGTGNTTVTGFINVSTTANVAGTLQVGGNTALDGDIVTFNTDYVVEVDSNTDIGTGTASPIVIYTFPKATYKTAKLMVQAANNNGQGVQMADMIIAHNGVTPSITVFGVVPDSAPVGDFSVSIVGDDVQLKMQQTTNNSKTKVVAHLIK